MPIQIRGFSLEQMVEALMEVRSYRPNQMCRLAREILFHKYYFYSGFNRDPFRQELALKLIDHFNIDTFVETGTYRGSTTGYIAERFSNLDIYSYESNEEFYKQASERLKGLPNISILRSSSEAGIEELLREQQGDKKYFFYLDAHWYDHWPLQGEIEAIARSGCTGIIMIDDFKVVGRDDFSYDVYRGGSSQLSGGNSADEKCCDNDLIRPLLPNTNDYRMFFPGYSSRDVYGRNSKKSLPGYITIFQNMDSKLVEGFTSGRLAKKTLTEFIGNQSL